MLYLTAFYLYPPIQSFLPADPSRLLSCKAVLEVSISALERNYFSIHKVSKTVRIFWIFYGIIVIGKAPVELGFEEKVRLLTVHANHPSPKSFFRSLLDPGGVFLNPLNSCSSRVLPLILEKAPWPKPDLYDQKDRFWWVHDPIKATWA